MSAAAKAALAELLDVLATERAAIRRLDGASVATAAERKQALASEISALEPRDLVEHAPALALLRSELRRNGILLAHARSCLAEVMSLGPARIDERL